MDRILKGSEIIKRTIRGDEDVCKNGVKYKEHGRAPECLPGITQTEGKARTTERQQKQEKEDPEKPGKEGEKMTPDRGFLYLSLFLLIACFPIAYYEAQVINVSFFPQLWICLIEVFLFVFGVFLGKRIYGGRSAYDC